MDTETEETFMPKVQTINPLADVPTTDHKALVIRLELNYYDYARLEELVQLGVDYHKDRFTALGHLQAAAKQSAIGLPEPLLPSDIEVVQRHQGEMFLAAQKIQKTIARPKDWRERNG
jgi:hypothetical protein